MQRLRLVMLVGAWLAIGLPTVAVADEMTALVRDYDAFARLLDPVRAGERGDAAALRRWPDDSPAALTERIPFIDGDGFYTVPGYAALNTVLRTEADTDAWLVRLAAIPGYYAVETANMLRGIRTGFTQPHRIVEHAIRDVRAQAEQPAAQSPLLKPFDTLPASFPAERRVALKARGLAVIESSVKPAQRTLLGFLERDYLPAARKEIGISSVPDGRSYYAYLVRRHTTTSMTPEEIHALGLQEVARIRAAMNQTIAETGFKATFPEFLAFLRSDPRFYVNSATYGEKASEVAKRADEALPRFFGRLPRLTYGVRPIPAGLESSSNGYLPDNPQQGVAGMVVYKPWMAEKMPTFGIAAWVLHEGVPGHHLQIALTQELTDLPEFRRSDDITAFVEGWGLYAEKLGEDMGIYRDPYERFGRLSLEACLKDNSALAQTEIEFEVDRYIALPGQALAYKIGEQKILELRRRAEQQLGPKFDLRAFHDLVLGAGPMPLALLESQVDSWIAVRGKP